jgi:hypothetical protein
VLRTRALRRRCRVGGPEIFSAYRIAGLFMSAKRMASIIGTNPHFSL